MQAVDLATKFLPHSKEVTSLVCDRLSHLGLYLAAGELMLNVDKVKEALDLFMAGEAWSRARDIAKNVAPRYTKQFLSCVLWHDGTVILQVSGVC